MPPNQSNAGATLASAAAPASATVRRRVSPAQHDVSTRDNGAGADLSLPEFSPEAVAEHNRPDDCWMIIEGLVYNVTSWCAICHLSKWCRVRPCTGKKDARWLRSFGQLVAIFQLVVKDSSQVDSRRLEHVRL